MANNKKSASGTAMSAQEKREYFLKEQEKRMTLRDVTKEASTRITTIDRETLKEYIKNISSNEKTLRNTSRYLYYRSNIYFRVINWYATMWNLRCRLVTPKYSFSENNDSNAMLKSLEDTLAYIDKLDMPGNMVGRLINAYLQDVTYAVAYIDETGLFFYELDPDECMIDSRYSQGDFGFSIDMSKWGTTRKQKLIEILGEPFSSMYEEYQKDTSNKWIHCPDEYASCFKFRTDNWELCIPPFLPDFLEYAGLADLIDIQAEADQLSIYKFVYLPMNVLSGAKESDDFEVDPDEAGARFEAILDLFPEAVGGAMVPGRELKTIDFTKTVDGDINSVEKSSNQILQTAGGGAVINANKITSTAAFNAWLKSETAFAISSLMPQVEGFVNRFLSYNVKNPSEVEYLPVSIYTQEDYAKQFLTANQYSYSYRLAYGTLLNVSERKTAAMLYMETDVLKLQDRMKYPLSSSFTSSGEVGQGAPTKDAGDLTDSGERDRNR